MSNETLSPQAIRQAARIIAKAKRTSLIRYKDWEEFCFTQAFLVCLDAKERAKDIRKSQQK